MHCTLDTHLRGMHWACNKYTTVEHQLTFSSCADFGELIIIPHIFGVQKMYRGTPPKISNLSSIDGLLPIISVVIEGIDVQHAVTSE